MAENELRRRINRLKEYDDAIARIRNNRPNRSDIEQFQNYLRYNGREMYERQIHHLQGEVRYRRALIERMEYLDTDPDDIQVLEAEIEALERKIQKKIIKRNREFDSDQMLQYFEQNEERLALLETRDRDLRELEAVEYARTESRKRRQFNDRTYKQNFSEFKVF